MNGLTGVPRNTGTIGGIACASQNPICDYYKAVAIEAYRKAGERDLPCGVQFEAKIPESVKRWTTHENVRIGFYIVKDSGRIRVKIIKSDTGEEACDMSLATFMDSSPENFFPYENKVNFP